MCWYVEQCSLQIWQWPWLFKHPAAVFAHHGVDRQVRRCEYFHPVYGNEALAPEAERRCEYFHPEVASYDTLSRENCNCYNVKRDKGKLSLEYLADEHKRSQHHTSGHTRTGRGHKSRTDYVCVSDDMFKRTYAFDRVGKFVELISRCIRLESNMHCDHRRRLPTRASIG